jgi:hypothetical protein
MLGERWLMPGLEAGAPLVRSCVAWSLPRQRQPTIVGGSAFQGAPQTLNKDKRLALVPHLCLESIIACVGWQSIGIHDAIAFVTAARYRCTQMYHLL